MTETEYSKVISKNLKRIMYDHDKTQADVAKDLNISKATISSWANGTRTPKMPAIDKLCHYFNCKRADLMEPYAPRGYSGRSTPHYTASEDFNNSGYWVPVLGDVAAGLPIEANEDIQDWEQLDDKLKGTGEHFALRIKGSSMEPRMMDGDVVIVRKQPDAESGEIVIVKVDGDSATCKKLLKGDDGITLIPFNTMMYQPIRYTAEEIESKPVTILGKVIELRGKF